MRFLRLFLLFLLLNSEAEALDICINTWVPYQRRLIGNGRRRKLRGGHAFVSVERNGVTEATYGFFKKVRKNSRLERPMNPDMVWEEINRQDRSVVYRDSKFCHPMDESRLKELDQFANNWVEENGEYGYFFNNCTAFAKSAYQQFSGDHIPIGFNSPNLVEATILEAQSQGRETLMPETLNIMGTPIRVTESETSN